MKICSRCGIEKPLTEFYAERGTTKTICKTCHIAAVCERRKAKRDGTWQRKERPAPDLTADKRCSRCGETKPRDAFYAKQASSDGLQSECKQCRNRAVSIYYAANRERYRVYSVGYRAANDERLRERRREYKRANRESLSAKARVYYRENRAALLAKGVTRHRDWYARNRGRSFAYSHARRAALRNVRINDFTADQWDAMLAYYGHRCGYCGGPLDPSTHDHMMPLARGGDHTEANIVPACRRCNGSKHAQTLAEFLLRN
jgi:5-methylcytosine-specific restriction endonuclease McrA